MTELDLDVVDEAPSAEAITPYDVVREKLISRYQAVLQMR